MVTLCSFWPLNHHHVFTNGSPFLFFICGSAMNIPAPGFTLFHWLTVGGCNEQKSIAMHHKGWDEKEDRRVNNAGMNEFALKKFVFWIHLSKFVWPRRYTQCVLMNSTECINSITSVSQKNMLFTDISYSSECIFSMIHHLLDYTNSHHWGFMCVYVLVGRCGLAFLCMHNGTVQTVLQIFQFCHLIFQKVQIFEGAWVDFSWSHLSAVLLFILVSPVVAQHSVSKPAARLSLWNTSLVFTCIWLPSVCFSVATPHFPVT